MLEWIQRWGYQVQKTRDPGVLRIRGGGFLVFGKVARRTVSRVVEAKGQREARTKRQAMLDAARREPSGSMQLFSAYATSLYERKVEQQELKSAKTRERWDTTLRLHLLPAFGSFQVAAITKLEVESWKSKVAKRIAKASVSPNTANGWLSILLVILRAAVDDLSLDKDPTLRVRAFPMAAYRSYTEEEPNALSPEQCRAFLAEMQRLCPQHYAMVLLGFVTGLRPSTLRAFRRRGLNADVLWDEKAILVRRSNALGQEVMETTKTGIRYRVGLPDSVMVVLDAHCQKLVRKRAASSLLFPARTGGFMSRSALPPARSRRPRSCAKSSRGSRESLRNLGGGRP